MLFRKLRRRKRPLFISSRKFRSNKKFRLSERQWQNVTAGAVMVLVMAIFVMLTSNLRPILTDMAAAEARDIVTAAVSGAVNERLSDGSLSYNELITLEKNNDGNIAALTTDMAKINTLQAEITNEIIQRVSDSGSASLRIPLGNLLGGNLLSGMGPGIPYKIVFLKGSSAELKNEFTSAGINQTKHEIILEITVDINILVPGGTKTSQVSSQVLVAETIIVGRVPDRYLNIEDIAG